MKKIMFLLFCTSFFFTVFSQPGIIWSTELPGNLESQTLDAQPKIAFDLFGNILTIKHERGLNGNQNVWLAKTSPEGNLLWDAFYDGAMGLTDEVYDIATDSDGNIFLHGITQTKAFVDDVGWELTPLTIKYGPNGDLLWEKTIPVPDWYSK